MRYTVFLAGVATIALARSASGAEAPSPVVSPPVESDAEIVVTAPQMRGAVKSDIPPEIELSPTDVASYGASTIGELLTALSAETTSARGRGGSGAPVVLLNGRRISGFQEIRELPTEAIERVQIMPEEVALKFGYNADQRIVNFILKDNFRQKTVEAKQGASTSGARYETTGEASWVKLGKKGRTSFSGSYTHDTPVFESDRGIVERSQTVPIALGGNVFGSGGGEIDPALSALAGVPVTIAGVPATPTLAGFAANANQPLSTNIGPYRTLLSATDDAKVNALVNRALTPSTSATLNVTYETVLNRSELGLPSALLTVPVGGASPFGRPVGLSRAFASPLIRDVRADTLHGGVTLDGDIAAWQWTVTGTYDRSLTNTATDAGVDRAALQAQVGAGTTNPFGSLSPALLPRDTARSESNSGEVIGTASGPALSLPAGAVRMTLRGGGNTTSLRSDATRAGIASGSSISRSEGNAKVNVDLPLTSRTKQVLPWLGTITLNANFGLRQLTDRGTLLSWGYGINWSPIDGMTLLATAIDSNNEPSLSQLSSPQILTPNVPVFDFTRGENAIVTTTSGGNPNLLTEQRRDLKFGLTYKPPKFDIVTLSVNYFHNRSTNPTAAFPTLTPALEAALPGRVTRDANGRLLTIDTRAINFAATASDVVRVGFNLSKDFGRWPGARGAGGPGGGRGGPGGGGGFGGGGRPGGFNRDGGRWNLALYDSVRLTDTVRIAPGLPALDLLGGDAIGGSGGSPRHSVDLEGGWFYRGLGFRVMGNYSSGSTVNGLAGAASTLQFGDLATLNVTAFLNFENRPKLTARVPFLKNSRVRLALTNLTGAVRSVRDGTGATPLSYQAGFLDPRGRVAELSFRKHF